MTLEIEEVPDADLRVGDVVDVLGGYGRIVEIRPYTGPIDFIIGIMVTVPGGSCSLTSPGWTRRVKS